MKIFGKKSPVDHHATTLAQLQLRAAALADKRSLADAALATATAARQAHRLDGDLGDEKLDTKLQGEVDLCLSRLNGLDADISTLQAKIADAEQRLDAERWAIERKAASEKLARDLDVIEKALPMYLDAGRRFTEALDELHDHFEATQMSAFVSNGLTQVEVASAFTLAELRVMVKAIANGTASIPAAKPAPAPVMQAEPPPPTMTVFMLKSARFSDHDGRKRFAGQYEDVTMPVATAQKAMRLGLAVSTADPRRATLRGSRGGDFVADGPDVVDIDTAEEGRNRNDVIASANFTPMPSGPRRTASISVARV